MKKSLIALSLIVIILTLPIAAAAQKTGIPLDSLINNIKNATWKVFGIIALISFVIAGVLFMTAGGEPEKLQKARAAFMWGVAGVIVGILAWSIITIVETIM